MGLYNMVRRAEERANKSDEESTFTIDGFTFEVVREAYARYTGKIAAKIPRSTSEYNMLHGLWSEGCAAFEDENVESITINWPKAIQEWGRAKETTPSPKTIELSINWSNLSAEEMGEILKTVSDLDLEFPDVMINSNDEGEK